MAFTFHVPQAVIQGVVGMLKKSYLVHPEAVFNPAAPQGYRKEIAYRDIDFLDRIGRKEFEEATVDSAWALLRDQGLIDPQATYDKQAFDRFREYHGQHMQKRSWTSLSPAMERMFYMLTSVKKPENLIELGCFWGNTLAWFAGPCLGPEPLFKPRRIIGIDVDENAIAMARENFHSMVNVENVQIIHEDARVTLDKLPGPFDFVYIETKAPNQRDLYLPMLKSVYDKMPKGAWVMAHDATRFTMQDELKDYFTFVRDKDYFSETVTFDIDAFGLELSIK
jgi:predicted O-methyltransferase YrrM